MPVYLPLLQIQAMQGSGNREEPVDIHKNQRMVAGFMHMIVSCIVFSFLFHFVFQMSSIFVNVCNDFLSQLMCWLSVHLAQ